MYFWQIGKPFPVSLTWKHCCTFELNLKCIFDKLEHLFPLFPYMKNLVSKAKEQKNNRKWIWNSKKKKRIRILVHILTFIAQGLPISQKKSIDLRNLKCFQHYVKEIKKWFLFQKIFWNNVRFISYSKCSNWRRISKLSSNFGCLFTFCYSAWAIWIKTKLQTCNLQIGQSISYKYVNQFWLNLPHPNSEK